MNNSSGIIPVLILVALLILSAGCTAANRTDIIKPVATPSTVQSHTGTAVDPNNETQLREFIADFDTYAGNAREAWKVPGMAVAIVKDGKIVFVKGYGTKTAGGPDPGTSRFPSRSISTSAFGVTRKNRHVLCRDRIHCPIMSAVSRANAREKTFLPDIALFPL